MSYFKTEEEKKSFRITVAIHIVIVLLLFLFGLKYFDPPIEQGIAVNFGTTDFGSGEIQPLEQIQTSPSQTQAQPETSEPVVEEDVVTQDNVEAPVTKKVEKPKENTTPPKEQPKERPKAELTPDKETSDAVSSFINAPKQDGVAQSGEGDDNKAGDEGSPDGSPYYGIGKGLDGDENYLLRGRRAVNKVIIVQDCDREGIVVVDITVDRNGNVTSAVPGVRGTTNNSKCLTDPARQAALETKFNSDPKAPVGQRGQIIYRFSLSGSK